MRYLKKFENFHRHYPEVDIEQPEVIPHPAHQHVQKKAEQKEEKEQHDQNEVERPDFNLPPLKKNSPESKHE